MTQFSQGGPDIPAELIDAQEAGRLVILCGAGSSITAGLPSFAQLVRDTYVALGESIDGDGPSASEKLSFEKGEFDRTLRGLERRLVTAGESGLAMRRRIRDAVRAQLAPPASFEPSHHAALMQLSRNARHRCRIVTTNFDVLFERSALALGLTVNSFAGAGLPRPGADRFEGVLHLHGRIADSVCHLDESELVLTSAEFGDAYLRDGWASQWLYDLARVATILLVGYRLEDPPVRYLLEALDFDRERFSDLHEVYALGVADEAGQEDSVWRSKGVTPVLYQPRAGDAHAPLWETIREWSRFAEDPATWTRARLASLSSPYDKDAEPALSEVVALLRRPRGDRLLGELAADPSWIAPLVESKYFADGRSSVFWIEARANDPAMAKAAIPLLPFDEWSVEVLQRALGRGAITDAGLAATWRLLLRARPHSGWRTLEQHRAETRIRRGEASFEDQKLIAEALRPRLRLSKTWRYELHGVNVDDDDPGIRPERVVDVDMELNDHIQFENLIDAWRGDANSTRTFVDLLTRSLGEALDEAKSIGFISDTIDRSAWDVPSVAPHAQNEHHHGFYPIIRVLADVWWKLADIDQASARAVVTVWRQQDYTLFRRLALHAASNEVVYNPAEAAATVASLSRDEFWERHCRLELMRLLDARLASFSEADQQAIETRTLEGPPVPPGLDDENAQRARIIVAREIFDRLSRLSSIGVTLSAEARTTLERLERENPDWQPRRGERSDFVMWSESGGRPPADLSPLAAIPEEQLLAEARRLQEEDSFTHRDIWQRFCDADPVRAFAALASAGAAGVWDGDAWREFLWAHTRKRRGERVEAISAALSAIPDEAFAALIPAASDWLSDAYQNEALTDAEEASLALLWAKMASIEFANVTGATDLTPANVLHEMLGASAGNLGDATWRRLGRLEPAAGSGIPPQLQAQFDAVTEAQGRSGVLARCALSRMLPWLAHVAPDWAEAHLVPLLAVDHPEAALQWTARSLHEHAGDERLFQATVEALLETFRSLELEASAQDRLFGIVLSLLLAKGRGEAAGYAITHADARSCLRHALPATRGRVAWELFHLLHATPQAERADLWRNQLQDLFVGIWPPDAALQDENTTSNLVAMAAETEDAFPDAVQIVLPYLFPGERETGFGLHNVRAEEHNLTGRFPEAVLTLLNALVPRAERLPHDLRDILVELVTAEPALRNDPRYARLWSYVRS